MYYLWDIFIHFQYLMQEDQDLLQTAPSLDSGSQWFDNVYGGNSSSGILTLVLGGEEKWSKINVIR